MRAIGVLESASSVHCYWFRDAEVYNKPAVLTIEAEDAFCQRLEGISAVKDQSNALDVIE